MKKIIILAISLIAMTSVFAQTSKPSVAIDELTYNSNIGTNWVTDLRNQIIAGFTGTGRVDVVDIRSIAGLPSAEADRHVHLKSANVGSLIKCHFNSLTGTSEVKDGKTSYNYKANYTLTLIDLNTGATKETKTYEALGFSTESSAASINDAMSDVPRNIRNFVDECFKLAGVVKSLDKIHPKKGVETMYVTIGTNEGIQVGQPLDIFVETDVAGEIITKQIKGTVKIKEVVSPTLSLASVSGKEAQAEILTYFENGKTIYVVSRPKTSFLDAMDSFLK